jgi:cyclopropane fatty-acyl-phospholipid synthase-like methyltransferase
VPGLDAEYFDQWYAAMPASPERERIQQESLGLPPHLLSTSLLPWDGIGAVAAALALRPGDTLIDLACGRGGYGLEIASRTGARLIGVDFSAVALEAARESAARNRPDVHAEFRLGSLSASGLPGDSAAAIMCVDAMQFADPYPAGFAECERLLSRGGRLVVTGWQPVDPSDEAFPDRLRHDIAATMTAAGFTDVEPREMPSWQRAEHAMWERALASSVDDEAMRAMRAEGERVAALRGRSRRLLVRGVAG